jgi:hypothetical protein
MAVLPEVPDHSRAGLVHETGDLRQVFHLEPSGPLPPVNLRQNRLEALPPGSRFDIRGSHFECRASIRPRRPVEVPPPLSEEACEGAPPLLDVTVHDPGLARSAARAIGMGENNAGFARQQEGLLLHAHALYAPQVYLQELPVHVAEEQPPVGQAELTELPGAAGAVGPLLVQDLPLIGGQCGLKRLCHASAPPPGLTFRSLPTRTAG